MNVLPLIVHSMFENHNSDLHHIWNPLMFHTLTGNPDDDSHVESSYFGHPLTYEVDESYNLCHCVLLIYESDESYNLHPPVI